MIDPKYIDAYNDRGKAYYAKHDFDRALADYARAVILSPYFIVGYYQLCLEHGVPEEQLRQALAYCNEAIGLLPNNAATLDSRGFINLRLGQLDEAIVDFNAALAIDPKFASSFYGRGLAELKKGELIAADADLVAARAIKSDIAAKLAGNGVK
jgi:tetratricopeptide (TPR) repeat protein